MAGPSSTTISPNDLPSKPSKSAIDEEAVDVISEANVGSAVLDTERNHGGLHRGLSARQVSMIAIAGTIGTGLFLGTGRALAQGGPASMLICYGVIGFIVYVTLLLLGEMGTQYPVAGSFNAYATRFFSPSYGFALSWNYWFNDAVSVASDLTAAQLVLHFWTTWNPWVISLVFWLFLVGVNATHVGAYGELEYWLSSLKIVTIVIFIVLGVFVNQGINQSHEYIGAKNWHIEGAPFVGGFGGFARVFVTASFAYGGTESLGVTAGETKNPSKNMPRVVKFVFWRILIFYILTITMIGLNVPWDYPNLSNRSTTTSPFTIVFQMAGSKAAASFMNSVILTSVLSAGNHALFAGTRVLYGLSTTEPVAQAPRFFSKTTAAGVPLYALLATSSIAWLSIGLASWRFRRAWVRQGRPLSEMKFRAAWTWPWGPYFVIVSVTAVIIIQGWSSVIPHFSAVDFVSFYIEIPVMLLMIIGWLLFHKRAPISLTHESVPQAVSVGPQVRRDGTTVSPNIGTPLLSKRSSRGRWRFHDLVDTKSVDLHYQEYQGDESDVLDDEERKSRLSGKARWLWRLYYWLA